MTGNIQAQSKFAVSDDDSSKRYYRFKSKDPFPSIYPSLLNSADITDYVSATGMIFPFNTGNLKSASYEIPLEGKIYYWNGNNEDCSQEIEQGKHFKLPKNSIAYVNLKVNFRIPEYIALRFNLRITDVHRGLLLGTGPLIDPGFEGNLLVPLHNLTSNDYVLNGGEGFIWVEFTKLNLFPSWVSPHDIQQRSREYREFPKNKNWLKASHYFDKAVGAGNNIKSSIPGVVINAEKKANEAAESAEKAATKAKYNFWGAAAIVIALAMGTPPILYLIASNTLVMKNLQKELNESKVARNELDNKLKLVHQKYSSEIIKLKMNKIKQDEKQ